MMSFDMMEARLDGMLVDKMETTVGHVVIVGGSDGGVKVFIGLPFSHPCDEGFVVAVELNGRKQCPLGKDVFDGKMEQGAGGKGKEHASSFSAEGIEFREESRGYAFAL